MLLAGGLVDCLSHCAGWGPAAFAGGSMDEREQFGHVCVYVCVCVCVRESNLAEAACEAAGAPARLRAVCHRLHQGALNTVPVHTRRCVCITLRPNLAAKCGARRNGE